MIPTRGADQVASAADPPASVAPTTIQSGGAEMDCFVVPWDSTIFGFAVAQIGRLELGTSEAATGRLFRRFGTWCAERQVQLVSCRLDHARLQESMALEAVGFRFVEMVYGPRLEALQGVAEPRLAIDVTEASGRDLAAIEEVASAAFTTGRFLLDRRLPPDLSGRRYAAWVRSAFEGSEQTVLKAELDGRLVGFFIAEHRVDRSVYWHLTAVAPGWQGQGIGLSLWQTMLQRHAAEGAVAVETTVSGHNLPVLNLYARLGFAFGSAQMTFHRLSATSS